MKAATPSRRARGLPEIDIFSQFGPSQEEFANRASATRLHNNKARPELASPDRITKCFFGALVARPTQTSLDRPLRIQQPTERRYLQNGDDLDLDQRALRQSRHLKRTARGVRGLEMARIHLVNCSEVVDVS